MIFATRGSDSTYIEKDLKKIPREYYGDFKKTLENIISNKGDDNDKKAKMMNSCNDQIKGLNEKKEWQIRTFYRILDDDCAYVVMTRVKKDDNSKLDRDEPIMRKKVTEKEFNKLKELIKDENKKQKLIEDNKKIYDSIIKSIDKQKSGEK